jgi:predicted GH43/DUF377 family glycosyl hydrolase
MVYNKFIMCKLFTRSKKNPILRPDKNNDWENFKVYNPGAIFHNNRYLLFYRAVGQNKNSCSSIGCAISKDGENFSRFPRPLLTPELNIEARGLEDPRLTKAGNKFYLTYTAYDGQSARLCLMTGPDLKSWKRHGEIFPDWDSKRAGEFLLPWDKAQQNESARRHWLKAGAIFPEKIKGQYHIIFGDRLLWTAVSRDSLNWMPEYEPWLKPRRGYFDSVHVEMGPPPLRTKKGWLILYHGIDENIVYRLGWLLLDLHNPDKIIKRCKRPFFEPKTNYELSGVADINDNETKPKVIFCNGAILKNNILRIYYGAGDSCINTATANINDIINLT